MRAGLLDLGFDDVLDFLDAEGAVKGCGELFDLVCDAVDAGFCELVCVIDGGVCLADGGGDLGGVEYGLRAVSFDDVHEWAYPSFCFRDVFWLPGA